MRIVFMGTPDFAVTVMKRLIGEHQVVAVVSQPDRARDRKNNLLPTPAKAYATSCGIPVLQFERISRNANELKALDADVFVTAAYGQLLSREILDIPPYGVLNVHASLLPKYRGSSPIQSAILAGEEFTGVSIMQTELGTDTGDVLMQRQVAIGDMNAGELSTVLAELGAELLLEVLKCVELGTVKRTPQNESCATKCGKIDKSSALIRFDEDSHSIYNRIRAFNPSPGAFTFFGGERIKIFGAECIGGSDEPGKIISADRESGLTVACGKGALRLKSLQPAGKRLMTDIEFINGNKPAIGDYFGK